MSWRRRLGWISLGIFCVWAFLASLPAPVRPMHPYFAEPPAAPWVIAHRGGWELWPEHTLHGYRRAIDMGVDVLELDVRTSADSVLVIVHDRTVDRTTDGQGRVGSLTLEKLRALDAGYRWSDDGGATFPYRNQGLQIPTLEEVLLAFPGQRLNIELKTDDERSVQDLCATLERFGHADRTLVAAFSQETLDRFRPSCPGVATSASFKEGLGYWFWHIARLDLFASTPFDAVLPMLRLGPIHVPDGRFIRLTQRRGLPVQPWTVDDEETMKQLIDRGVHGIITRRPDRLIDLLRERGLR